MNTLDYYRYIFGQRAQDISYEDAFLYYSQIKKETDPVLLDYVNYHAPDALWYQLMNDFHKDTYTFSFCSILERPVLERLEGVPYLRIKIPLYKVEFPFFRRVTFTKQSVVFLIRALGIYELGLHNFKYDKHLLVSPYSTFSDGHCVSKFSRFEPILERRFEKDVLALSNNIEEEGKVCFGNFIHYNTIKDVLQSRVSPSIYDAFIFSQSEKETRPIILV